MHKLLSVVKYIGGPIQYVVNKVHVYKSYHSFCIQVKVTRFLFLNRVVMAQLAKASVLKFINAIN